MKRSEQMQERPTAEDAPLSDEAGSPEPRNKEEKIRRVDVGELTVEEVLKMLDEERKAREEERKAREATQEALEKERKDREEERKAAQEALDKANAIKSGNYYTTIENVWGFAPSQDFDDPIVFSGLVRSILPGFTSRAKSLKNATRNEYCVTKDAAEDSENTVASKSPRSSNVSSEGQQIFATNIFGQTKQDHQHIAHLVPHSSDTATLYADAAIWVFGFGDIVSFDTLRRSIHGSIEKNGGKRRIVCTGLKHFVSNKICFAGQAEYFDRKPCVLIVPVMSAWQMVNWNGEGYKALVMVGGWGDTDAATVCKVIDMDPPGDVATEPEIEEARKLLQRVVLGMAYWMKNRSEAFGRQLPVDSALQKTLNDLRGHFTTVTGAGVKVPVAKSGQDNGPLKIRIVEFSDVRVEDGHPAPDPLLLAVRAAATWSWRNEQKLKAAAEPQEDEDELSVLANEQFLEWRRNAWRPESWDDLARGLGQPFGYQPEGETIT